MYCELLRLHEELWQQCNGESHLTHLDLTCFMIIELDFDHLQQDQVTCQTFRFG